MKTSSRKTSWSGILVFLVVLWFAGGWQDLSAQGVGISEAEITPDGSAILELRYSSGDYKGFLAPRMTYANMMSIPAPAQGLLVYATDKKSFFYYDDLKWKPIGTVNTGTGNQILGVTADGTANEYKTLIEGPNIEITHAPGSITVGTTMDPEFDNLTVNDDATIGKNLRVDENFQFDATGQNVNNISTTIRPAATADDITLVTESAVRDAISSSVSADNGLYETTDGTIRLGGNLIENTTVTNNGYNLTISGTNGNLVVAPTGNTSVTGTATLTTGTGQVTFGGNVDAGNGVDVSGAPLTVTNQEITQTGTGQVTFGGNVDAGSGVDVTGDLTVSNNADVNGTLDVAGSTSLAATGLPTNVRGSLTVAENATISGNSQVNGTFKFDASGQAVDNIRTDVRAVGDDISLVTEAGIRTAINTGIADRITANNGLNEDPDGNIQLGGNLTENTTITNNTYSLTVSGSDGNLVVAPTGNTSVTGTATLTTGTGQVTLGGNVDAGAGVDVTGLLQADDNVTIGSSNADALVVNATTDFNDVVTVDGATTLNNALTVSDGATVTSILNNTVNIGNAATDVIDLTGATNINGGNLTVASPQTDVNSAAINLGDAVTDAIDLTGVTNINGGNLTIASPQTDVNSDVINLGNAASDAIDITGITNLNGGSVTISASTSITGRLQGENALLFDGATSSDGNYTILAVNDPTGVRTIRLPNASGTLALETAGNSWNVDGNSGTNPTNDFIGTTDNQDMVFRTNNVESMRIQASTGDLIFGGASVGTVKAEDELNMRMDGDDYGSSILQLHNRTGENGAVFQTIPSVAGTDLVDFIFKTADGAGTVQRNLRFEARSTYARTGDPSFEIGGSNPDLPTLSIGDSYAAFSKPVYIAEYAARATNNPYPDPTALLQLAPGSTAAGTAPLKFSSGTVLTAPEPGAIEYDGTNLYATNNASTRKTIAFLESPVFTTPNIGAATGTSLNLSSLDASRPVKTDASENLVSASIDLASSDVTGVLPVANGGTGSSSRNFVDLSSSETIAGTKTFSSSPVISSLTAGSIPFISSTEALAEDNANLFWDDTNNRLSIGAGTDPTATLEVQGDINVTATGSTLAAPRRIGFSSWGADNAGKIIFGDDYNAIQNGYGQRLQLIAYYGVDVAGHREFAALPGFKEGEAEDASLNVIGTIQTAPILTVSSPAGLLDNMQEWRNSAGTALASVNASGEISSSGITSSGRISSTSSSAGIGYADGAGGSITQGGATKDVAVTLNTITGRITMNTGSLTNNASVTFRVSNSSVQATDVPVVSVADGINGVYLASITEVGASYFDITIVKISGPNSEAIVLNYAIIKGDN